MKKLVISGFIEKGVLRIRMNDALIIDGNGDFEMDLESGTMNILTWFVEGVPKSNFRITVSSPVEASFQINKSLGISGKDTGTHIVES